MNALISIFAFGLLCCVHIQRTYAQVCRIDLGVILDESGSIKRWGFDQEKKFVADIARQLTISSTNTRVAVMTFSTHARMRIYFRDGAGQNWNSLHYGLGRIGWGGGWTYTHKALDLARNYMFNTAYGSRAGAPKMLLLLTDGKSQSHWNTLSHSATLLKNKFVNIMTIGIGRDPRKSELELMASRPVQSHVFRVADAYALSRIVNTVKTEACKPVTCWFIECIYHDWSSWSGTCNAVFRTRTVSTQIRKSKMVVGGCAGLNVLNCKGEMEFKNLGRCLYTCPYVKCNWAPWGAWSHTCGPARRQRQIQATKSTTQRRNCRGLPQRCYQKPQGEGRVTPCTCNYVDCQYGAWSQWTTSCGKGERSRQMQTIKKTIQKDSCVGLKQTCPSTPDVQTRTEMCTCNYVECQYGAWSQWTTTCGKGERSRKMQTIKKTIQKDSCAGLKQTCPSTPDVQTRTEMCTCNYVECQYGAWSQWTTSCGKGERSRKMQTIKKTIQKDSCAGLKQTCPSTPDVQTRTEMCTCNYVECQYGAWSQWTTSCGKGQRSRQMQTTKKTIQKESCNGLKQSCPTAPEVQTRTEMCTCNYVECQYGAWSQWTTSCGKGERSRKMQTIKKTIQKDSCAGLKQTCPSTPDVETRTQNCKCNYVECKYGAWSEWTPKCGNNMSRKKTLQVVQKTIERGDCSGLKQKCTEKNEVVEKKNELCECDTFKCEMEWSAWSATCGPAQRVLRFKKVAIKVKKDSCDGLDVNCPTGTEIQKEDFFCTRTSPPLKTDGPSDAICHIPYKEIGCYKESTATAKIFTKTMFHDHYSPSKIFTKEDYLLSTICNCAVRARMEKLDTFALKDGGLCMAGKDLEHSLNGDSNELQKAKGSCTVDSSKAFKVYKLA